MDGPQATPSHWWAVLHRPIHLPPFLKTRRFWLFAVVLLLTAVNGTCAVSLFAYRRGVERRAEAARNNCMQWYLRTRDEQAHRIEQVAGLPFLSSWTRRSDA